MRIYLSIILAQLLSSVCLATNPLGTNLASVNYYGTNFPFLNIIKECGAGSPTVNWWTQNSGTFDTGEELKLNLDPDGYPLAIPQAGLTSTFVTCYVFDSSTGSLSPGQTSYYPSGSYTVQFSGSGTIQISGDANATITSSGGTFTVSNPTATGLHISITASASGNHLHNLSIVQTSLNSSYSAGAIFHPRFLATLQNYSSLRFMDWKNTNGQAPNISYSGTLSVGATSLKLTTAWSYPTGTYNIYFEATNDSAPQSEMRAGTFTAGSTAVTWSGGLSNRYTSGYTPVDASHSWANRALPSNVSYTLNDGVPIEVAVALCNTIGANCWLNLPLTASDSYIKSWAALVINGTGAQSGYSRLNSGLTLYAELSNEVWNSGFQQYGVASTLGYLMWPTQVGSPDQYLYNRNWYGMRVAQMATDLQTQLVNEFSRCVPVMGAQAANPYSATTELAATFWTTGTGPPSSYPIKALAIASYWGQDLSTADANTMLAVATPLDDFFAVFSSNTGTSANGSHVYSSVPANGWYGQAQGWFSAYVTLMASLPSINLVAYEGGQGFAANNSVTSGYAALVTSAERDTRMGTSYTTMLNWWKTNVGGTSVNIENLFNDISVISQYGAYGALEDVMQPITPLNSAPPKFQAIQNFICLGSVCPTTSVPMPPTNLVIH